MKDIVIKVKQQKKELFILATCFLLAFLSNLYSIITYHTQWSELYSQWQIIVLMSFFFYMVIWGIRLLFLGIRTVIVKFSKRK